MAKFYALLIVPFLPMIIRHAGDWLDEAISKWKAKRKQQQHDDS